MVQTVISAPPRTGKSLYTVEVMERITRLESHRMIYTNIIGITLPGVISIKSSTHKPFDWRDLPNGAVLVYDEAHEHPAFSKIDLLKTHEIDTEVYDNEISRILDYKKLSTEDKIRLLKRHNFIYTELPLDLKVKEQEQLILKVRTAHKNALEKSKEDILDIGRSLTMHGHFGIDIYLISQKPDLLNGFVRAATSEHLILRRYFKLPFAIIYSYLEVQESFGNATRKNAMSWRFWLYPKKLYKYYISAESHPTGSTIPTWIYASIAMLICIFGYAIYNSKTTDADLFAANQVNHTEKHKPTSPVAQNNQKNVTALDQYQTDLTNFCRIAANVDTPECKKFFDNLTKSGGSLKDSNFVYDPSKPYDVEYKPTDLKPTDFPRFKNAIVYNGKCTAYSQQGTIMHDVSKTDCMRLASGDRPFDYFAKNTSSLSQSSSNSVSTERVSTSEQIIQNPETSSL